jgi:hypothetical protein
MNAIKLQTQWIFRFLIVGLLAAAVLSAGITVFASSRQTGSSASSALGAAPLLAADGKKISTVDFQNAMRKLWEEHVTWTRLYIVSAAADLPDKSVTAQRLLQNQVDIGNAIKPFYGDAAGNQLTALLKDHILLAAALIDDVKAGDSAKAKVDSDKWYANADEIAAFLSSANPKNWPLSTMKAEMKMHLDQTLTEAADRLNGKYADDIKAYDVVENHILGMADVLSSGIIKQFPSHFTH